MAITYDDYINHITTSKVRTPIFKIEFLRQDETVLKDISGYMLNTSGVLNISNTNGVRRNMSIEINNLDKSFLPDTYLLPIRQKFRLWTGLKIDGEEYLIKQGVFVLRNPRYNMTGSQNTFSLNGIDKFGLADGTLGGETDGIYDIPVGTSIPEAVRRILLPSDDWKKEIFYDSVPPYIDPIFNAEVTPYSFEISAGTPVSELLIKLAEMVSANIYYNRDGRFVFEKDVPDSHKASVFGFEAGDINWMETTKTYEYEKVYNSVLVQGVNINGVNISYEEVNDNLYSDTAVQYIGKRTKLIVDSNITTVPLLEDRAKYELKRVSKIQNSQSFTSVPIYHINVDEIISITDSKQNSNRERNLVNTLSIPLTTGGTMSGTVSKELVFD